MKFHQSIRFRIVTGFLLFGALLIILNSGIIFFIIRHDMSRMISNLIETEVATFLYKYEKDRETPLPHSKYIEVHKGIEEVPERLKKRVQGLGPGIHAIEGPRGKRYKHVGVMELEGQDELYYMFFHGREFFEENTLLSPGKVLMLSLALLLIPGIIIGYFTSRMLFAPVVSLMEKIRSLNPEKIPTHFSPKHADNEIGMLTRTIEAAMNRINAFIQREKQFTRDASHELRTPLTVVKGAVEIMDQQPELESNPLLEKPLKRIRQSVRDMETTIETFLWLAREDDGSDEGARVEPLVRKAIDANRYLIENRDIDLQVTVNHDKIVMVKEEILYIAVANLIRNAFQFTSRGSITITIEEAQIRVQDTGIGIEPDQLQSVTESHVKGAGSQGFGLGLSIVSRLCKRFGWQLEIDSRVGQGTRVGILWHDT